MHLATKFIIFILKLIENFSIIKMIFIKNECKYLIEHFIYLIFIFFIWKTFTTRDSIKQDKQIGESTSINANSSKSLQQTFFIIQILSFSKITSSNLWNWWSMEYKRSVVMILIYINDIIWIQNEYQCYYFLRIKRSERLLNENVRRKTFVLQIDRDKRT